MEDHIRELENKITQLQTDSGKTRQVVISPNIPTSLFVNGPAGEDALYLPKGKITQIALTLIGPKDCILHLNVVQAGRNITEDFNLKLGQVILTRTIDIDDWSIVRAKITTDDLMARLVIGFNFQPTQSYVTSKGVVDEGDNIKPK